MTPDQLRPYASSTELYDPFLLGLAALRADLRATREEEKVDRVSVRRRGPPLSTYREGAISHPTRPRRR